MDFQRGIAQKGKRKSGSRREWSGFKGSLYEIRVEKTEKIKKRKKEKKEYLTVKIVTNGQN